VLAKLDDWRTTKGIVTYLPFFLRFHLHLALNCDCSNWQIFCIANKVENCFAVATVLDDSDSDGGAAGEVINLVSNITLLFI